MYSVTVRDHVMIAHSLVGSGFAAGQSLHGASYAVDAEFRRRRLSADGVVVATGAAQTLLKQALAPLNYRNLDDEPAFRGRNTTMEFLAGEVWRAVAAGIRAGDLGGDGMELDGLRITLSENQMVWAAYEAPLPMGVS